MFKRLVLIAVCYTLGVLTAPKDVLEARGRFINSVTKKKDALVSKLKK